MYPLESLGRPHCLSIHLACSSTFVPKHLMSQSPVFSPPATGHLQKAYIAFTALLYERLEGVPPAQNAQLIHAILRTLLGLGWQEAQLQVRAEAEEDAQTAAAAAAASGASTAGAEAAGAGGAGVGTVGKGAAATAAGGTLPEHLRALKHLTEAERTALYFSLSVYAADTSSAAKLSVMMRSGQYNMRNDEEFEQLVHARLRKGSAYKRVIPYLNSTAYERLVQPPLSLKEQQDARDYAVDQAKKQVTSGMDAMRNLYKVTQGKNYGDRYAKMFKPALDAFSESLDLLTSLLLKGDEKAKDPTNNHKVQGFRALFKPWGLLPRKPGFKLRPEFEQLRGKSVITPCPACQATAAEALVVSEALCQVDGHVWL